MAPSSSTRWSLQRIIMITTALAAMILNPITDAYSYNIGIATPLSIFSSRNRLFGQTRPTCKKKSQNYSMSNTCYSSSASYSPLLFSTTNGSENSIQDVELQQQQQQQQQQQRGGLLQSIDNFGLNLKPLAVRAHERSLEYSNNGSSSSAVGVIVNGNNNNSSSNNNINIKKSSQMKAILYSLKSCTLWIMYLVYRAYRGFFVILPAVFKEVFRKLEESQVVVDAFGEEGEGGDGSRAVVEPMRLRTRITISVLSSVLTLSYVVSGALRVFGKFIKTFTSTTSVESSLEAAADEVVRNEEKLRKMK